MMSSSAPSRPAPTLKARALRHLARREHSRAELAGKLAPHEPDAALVQQLLDQLQAQGWLSDERFAAALVRAKASRYGVRRLRADLQAKGLSAASATHALQSHPSDELDRAHAWWLRKFGQPPQTPHERAKQVRHLLSRGFEPDVVRRVVPGVEPGVAPDTAAHDGEAIDD
jgi:regulatory protein